MSIIRLAADERFWDTWKDRFLDNAEDYITPNEPAVKAAVSNAGVCSSDDGDENSKDLKVDLIWSYIYEEIDYKLSEEWKEPKETLNDGIGDCEDVSFLAASMMLRAGIDGFDYVIGYMEKTGPEQKHTWLEVDGRVVDPTSPLDGNGGMKYTAEERFVIKT